MRARRQRAIARHLGRARASLEAAQRAARTVVERPRRGDHRSVEVRTLELWGVPVEGQALEAVRAARRGILAALGGKVPQPAAGRRGAGTSA